MLPDRSRRTILTRRAAFVAAALSATGCQEGASPRPVEHPAEEAGGEGTPSADAAPHPCLSVIPAGKVEIQQKIYFEPNQDVIREVSKPVLDAVVYVMRQNQYAEFEVAGHSDPTEPPSLGDSRAQAVRAYLVTKGIDGARLRAKGYAALLPADTNTTADGRAHNRRVEFHRVDP